MGDGESWRGGGDRGLDESGGERGGGGGGGGGETKENLYILSPLFSLPFPSHPIPPRRFPPSQSSSVVPLLSFDHASLFGWFGILLAVQRQPVIAHIEARASSFLNYDGVSE